MYFNKKCLEKRVTPKYANLKFNHSSPAAKITTRKAKNTQIKDEMTFLYKKKTKLNYSLYKTHLEAAKEWGNMWYPIQRSTCEKLYHEMEVKYKSLDAKINKLAHAQIRKPDNKTESYPRVVNQTNIIFTNEEMTLLNKGLKYNVQQKGKHWLSNLALEAEAAVMRLPVQEQEPIRHMVAHSLQKLCKQFNGKHPPNDRNTRNEIKIVNQIRRKLEDSHAIVANADKGNSMIILYED
jgi:hypothetical protein